MTTTGSFAAGTAIGGYTIERLLGVGGMGEVYLARQRLSERPIALKVLRPELSDNAVFRSRFLLEARTAASIRHPNVVATFDAGDDDGRLFIASELITGGDFSDRLERGPLPVDEAIVVGLAVARALVAAWAEGVVHLDIKPANVLIDDDGIPKVTDFGIARRVRDEDEEDGSGRATSSTIEGTPPYMPIEQWQGLPVDGRTDLYALGISIFVLLEKRYPFTPEDAATPREWLEAHLLESPLPLSAGDPPETLVDLVGELTGRAPEDRPDSAAVVARKLEAIQTIRGGAPTAPAVPAKPAPIAPAGPRLVGRDAELGHVTQIIRRAHDGHGDVIVFSGPRGVGRSRLLLEASGIAARSGARVLHGAARADAPLAAVRAILADFFGIANDAPVEERRETLRSELARLSGSGGIAHLLRALEPFLLETGGDLASVPELPTALLAWLIRQAATPAHPIAITVDDLHDADHATISFLVSLAEATERAPIVLIVSAANGPVGDAVVRELASRAAIERHAVSPLGIDAMSTIADWAFEAAGEATIRAAAAAARGLPRAVTEAKDHDDLDQIEALIGAAATAFEAASTPPPASVEPAETESARVERLLGQALDLRAFHDYPGAIAALDRLLPALERGLPPPLEVRLRRELARTLRLAGERLEQAVTHARLAAERARADGAALAAAEASIEAALALYLLRKNDESLSILDAAARDLQSTEPGGVVEERLHQRLRGEISLACGAALSRSTEGTNAEDADDAFAEAMNIAAALGDQDLFGRAAHARGEADLRRGDLASASRLLTLSASYKERLGDFAGLAIAYGGLGRLAIQQKNRAAAIEWFDRDLAIARRIADLRGVGVAANSLGELYEEVFLESGDPRAKTRAETAFDIARIAAERSGNPMDRAISAYYRGRFLIRCEREPSLGNELIGEAIAELSRLGNAGLVGQIRERVAELSDLPPLPPWAEPQDTVTIGETRDPVLDAIIDRRRLHAAELERLLAEGRPRLVFPNDSRAEPLPLDQAEIILGSEPGPGVVTVAGRSVSARQARVFWSRNDFIIEDLGSKNGTRLGALHLGRGERARLLPHTALWLGGLACLFVAREVHGSDADDRSDDRPSDADPRLVLEYLVRREWIGRGGADEILTRGDALDAVAEDLVRRRAVTPDQWAEAHRAACFATFLD